MSGFTNTEMFVLVIALVAVTWALTKPGPRIHPAQEAWDRGDDTYVYRHPSTWTTGSWSSATAHMNRQVAAIAAIGWQLTGGSRQPLHGSILFTFVRPPPGSVVD